MILWYWVSSFVIYVFFDLLVFIVVVFFFVIFYWFNKIVGIVIGLKREIRKKIGVNKRKV